MNWRQEGNIDDIYYIIKFLKWQIQNNVQYYNQQSFQAQIDKFNRDNNIYMLQNRSTRKQQTYDSSNFLIMRPDLFTAVYNEISQGQEENSICLLQNEHQDAITLLDYELMQNNNDSKPHALYIANESKINQDLLENINLQHIYISKNNQFSFQHSNYQKTLLQICLVECKYQSLKQFQNLKILTFIDVKNIKLTDFEDLQDLQQITIQKCLNVKDVFDYLTLNIQHIYINNSMLNYEIIIRKHMPYLRYLKLFLVRSKKLILQYNLSSLEFLSLDMELELMYRVSLQSLMCIELCHNQQKELNNLSLYNCPRLVFIKVVKLYRCNLILRSGQLLQYKNYRIDLLHYQVYNTYLDRNQIIPQLNTFFEFPLIIQESLNTMRHIRANVSQKYYEMIQKLDRARLIYQTYCNYYVTIDQL